MKKQKVKDGLAEFGVEVVLKYKFLILILIAAVVIASFMGLEKIKVDSSNESFFPENDKLIQQNDRFKEIFGNEEFVFILIENEEIFTPEVLTYIRELTADLEENLPFVKEVTSITNVESMEAEGYNLVIEDLIGKEIPDDRKKLNRIKKRALNNRNYVDKIISEDGRKTGIVITFKDMPREVYLPVEEGFTPLDQVNFKPQNVIMASDIYSKQHEDGKDLTAVSDPRKLIAPALQVILDRHQREDIKTSATGIPVLDYEVEEVISSESARFGLIALIACAVMAAAIFRSVPATVGPFLVILGTLIILFGAMGWLGIEMSMVAIIIPTLILVISVSYSIHVINHFQYAFDQTGSRKEAVRYAYREATWPILVTGLTTVLGFVSFIAVPVKPVRIMGLLCSTGVVTAYLLVMLVIPIILSLGRDKETAVDISSKQKSRHLMVRLAQFTSNYKGVVVVVFILFTFPLIYYSFKVPATSDFLQIVGDKVETVKRSKYITDKLGALYSYEIMIELPEEGEVKDPAVLKETVDLVNTIKEWESTKTVGGLPDLIKEINQKMHGNKEEFYRIPDSRNLIAQYLLLYEMSGGSNLQDWVDVNYQKLHLSVQINTFSSRLESRFTEIKDYVKSNFPAGTRVSVVGDVPIMLKMIRLLKEGQVKSIAVALGVITLVLMAVLRSVKLGFLSIIPNTLPVIAITGVMGLLKFPLDLVTILVAPMIIGIAVDDTVHYFLHFREEFAETDNYVKANRETFRKIGRALVFTSIILTLGFAIFGFSRIESMVHLAILAGSGIITALLADLLIAPAVIMFFKPFNKKITK